MILFVHNLVRTAMDTYAKLQKDQIAQGGICIGKVGRIFQQRIEKSQEYGLLIMHYAIFSAVSSDNFEKVKIFI